MEDKRQKTGKAVNTTTGMLPAAEKNQATAAGN